MPPNPKLSPGAPITPPNPNPNRERLVYATAAKTQLEAGVHNFEQALENLDKTGVAHVVTGELRDTLIMARRLVAKTEYLVKRIP